MSDGWSCRMVRQLNRGKWIGGIILDGYGWRRSQSEAVSVAGGCLYTMSVHDVCTRWLYTICRGLSAQHLFDVSMVPIGRHPNWGTQLPLICLGQTWPSGLFHRA